MTSVVIATLILPTRLVAAESKPFLSDQKTSYAILESYQKLACAKMGNSVCALDEAACRKRFTDDTLFEEKLPDDFVTGACSRISTRYELPGVYFLLRNLFDEVLKGAHDLGYEAPTEPAIGSLPIQEINATISSDEDVPVRVIVLNLGFFTFANTLAKSSAETLEFKTEGDHYLVDVKPTTIYKKITADPGIMERHVSGVLFSLGRGPDVAIGSKETYPFVLAYTEGSELFAVAHEYAHLLLKHTSAKSSLAIDDPCSEGKSLGSTANAPSWAEEMEADLLAHRILGAIAKRRLAAAEGNIFGRHVLVRSPAYYFLLQQVRRDAQSLLAKGVSATGVPADEAGAVEAVLACLKQSKCDAVAAIRKAAAGLKEPARHPNPRVREQVAEQIARLADLPGSEERQAMWALADGVNAGTRILAVLTRPVYPELAKDKALTPVCAKVTEKTP